MKNKYLFAIAFALFFYFCLVFFSVLIDDFFSVINCYLFVKGNCKAELDQAIVEMNLQKHFSRNLPMAVAMSGAFYTIFKKKKNDEN